MTFHWRCFWQRIGFALGWCAFCACCWFGYSLIMIAKRLARHGGDRQGEARNGEARQGEDRQGVAGRGAAGRRKARLK